MFLCSHHSTLKVLLQAYMIYLQFVVPSTAFKCYVCDSKTDFDCLENLSGNERLQPVECKNITKAGYCVKTTNIYAGEHGTKRFCAANDHGNYCKYFKLPERDIEHRGCVFTCDTEMCNVSTGLYNYNLALPAISMALITICALNNLIGHRKHDINYNQ